MRNVVGRQPVQTAAEHVAQLREIAEAQANVPGFEPGQFVARRTFTLPVELRDDNHLAVGVVIEVTPNMRELTGEREDTTGPGVRLAILGPDGGYAETWAEAWQYELVSPERLAAIAGETSH